MEAMVLAATAIGKTCSGAAWQLESIVADRPIEVLEGPKTDPSAREAALVGRAMSLARPGRQTGSPG